MGEPRVFYRMPIGYGPFPGPRQIALGGNAHLHWDNVRTKSVTVVFKAPRETLSSFLPHECFQIDGGKNDDGQAYASINFTRLDNLPWLAGRGYNHCGLYIHDVVCQGKHEQKRGKYLSVLFENLADPIISGREELGWAKVFATLEENEISRDQLEIRIGWEGSVFGVISLNGLKEGSATDTEAKESNGASQGLLHFKYIPRTGSNGHDAMYPTFSPAPLASSSLIDRVKVATFARLEFHALGFDNLPTLHHIASRLANLPMNDIIHARIVEATGTTDIRGQVAVELEAGSSLPERKQD